MAPRRGPILGAVIHEQVRFGSSRLWVACMYEPRGSMIHIVGGFGVTSEFLGFAGFGAGRMIDICVYAAAKRLRPARYDMRAAMSGYAAGYDLVVLPSLGGRASLIHA